MAEPSTNTTSESKAMTAAQAAKAVRRPVVTKAKDGAVTTSFVPVKADEVLAFKDHGTHVVVVTVDGQKFSSADAKAEA